MARDVAGGLSSPRVRLACIELAMLVTGTALAAYAARHTVPLRPSVVAATMLLMAAFYVVEVVPLHLEWNGQAYSLSLSEVPLVVGLLCWPTLLLVFARVLG